MASSDDDPANVQPGTHESFLVQLALRLRVDSVEDAVSTRDNPSIFNDRDRGFELSPSLILASDDAE